MTNLINPPPQVTAWSGFDQLATLVAVVRIDGTVVFANAALEDALEIAASARSKDEARLMLERRYVRPAREAKERAGKKDQDGKK